MNVSILTLFPELYKEFFQTSLLKRAQEKELASFSTHSLFDYVKVKERIDAPTFGHSSGMLVRPDIVEKAMDSADGKYGKSFKIMLSPQGKKLDQRYAKSLWKKIADKKHVSIFASRYEGIDHRVQEHYADEVISVGDFVTMGGDIPAMLLIECLFRYMPGIVGKTESVELDSFSGAFVDHPEYTKPVVWKDKQVPDVLRSGNHAAIQQWREQKSAELTVYKHFSWLRSSQLTKHELSLVQEYIPHHYAALLHSDILLKDGSVGTSSVTTLDIHDIARSAATYGLKNFFIQTPLKDQQKIVQTLLDFWQESSIGGEYNQDRHKALHTVKMEQSLEDVIHEIEKKEGKKPIVIGTSARLSSDYKMISYQDQDIVWQEKRPVLFLFGTSHGIADVALKKCDYMLHPLQGFTKFNHLSVRSAAAIIFDKWLGFSWR